MKIPTEFGDVTLRKIGKRWYARKQHLGKRYEKRMPSYQEDQAIEEARQWLARLLRGVVDADDRGEPAKRYISRMFAAARSRAKKEGIAYELTPEQERDLYLASGGSCALTGLAFRMGRAASCYRAPFAPSLDRIAAGEGYTRANVRLVCVAVNWALSDWGEGVFRQMCSSYAAKMMRELGGDSPVTLK